MANKASSIQSLLRSLPRTHLRELADHAASLDFRFDIIGNLPIEILCLVFMNLDIYQAFQLRRVSKRWLAALSAPQIVESMLCPWFSLGPVDLRMPPNVSEEESLAIKAEHVDAFKTGNPFSMVQGEWKIEDPANDRVFDYGYGRIAWFEAASTRLHVRNLESGQNTVYTPSSREKLQIVRLSSDIVAALTASGKCYVWEHATGVSHKIRLPSAWFSALAVSGKSLAIAHAAEIPREKYITTWTLSNLRTRSFPIEPYGRPQPEANGDPVTLMMTNDSVIIIQRDMGPPDEYFFTRYTLEGEVIAHGSSGLKSRTFRSGFLHISMYPQNQATSIAVAELDRTKVRDEHDKDIRALRQTLNGETCGFIEVIYDLLNDRLDLTGGAWKPSKFYGNIGIEKRAEIWQMFWKTTSFQIYQNNEEIFSWTSADVLTGTTSEVCMYKLERDIRYREGKDDIVQDHRGRWFQHMPVRVIGDEIYMVRIYVDGFTAFCFDKNITMAGENIEYPQQREAARRERIRHLDDVGDYWTHVEAKQEERRANIEQLAAKLAAHEREQWVREGIMTDA